MYIKFTIICFSSILFIHCLLHTIYQGDAPMHTSDTGAVSLSSMSVHFHSETLTFIYVCSFLGLVSNCFWNWCQLSTMCTVSLSHAVSPLHMWLPIIVGSLSFVCQMWKHLIKIFVGQYKTWLLNTDEINVHTHSVWIFFTWIELVPNPSKCTLTTLVMILYFPHVSVLKYNFQYYFEYYLNTI